MKKISSIIISLFVLASCSNVTPTPSNQVTTTNSPKTEVKASKTINVGKVPHGMWQAGGFVYNSNIGEGTVSVIDTKTDLVVKTIKFEDGTPGYVKSFHDDKNVMITDTKKGELVIIDPAQDHKIIQKISLGKSPDKIKVSDDDKKVFVSLVGENKIIALTFDTDRSKAPEKKEFTIGGMLEKSEHRSLSFSDGWIATPNIADNDVSLINTTTGVEKRLKDGNNPAVVDIGSTGGKVSSIIVGNTSSNTVTIFDINSDTKKTLSDVGLAPTESVVVESLNRVFITMAGSNEVAVIDYDKKVLVGKIAVGKRPVHIYSIINEPTFKVKHDENHADSLELWVGNDDGESISIIDPMELKVKSTISVGKGHHKMAFTANKGYVSNITDNTVSIIDRK